MNSNHSSGQTSRSASSPDPESFGAAAKSAAKDMGSEHVRHDEDLNKLRRDMASLTEAVTYLASQVGDQAAKTVRNMSQIVASQVSGVADTGSELASSARNQAKTFASELEGMARRNPLGTVAGALLVGVIIGMISRGRN